MRISTKGRYATRIMVSLARRESDTPLSKDLIAADESISPGYAEQILLLLKAAGLVAARRGAHGGFLLAREPDAITMEDILTATEGPIAPAPCTQLPCRRSRACAAHSLWFDMAEAMKAVLRKTSLADLAGRPTASVPAGARGRCV